MSTEQLNGFHPILFILACLTLLLQTVVDYSMPLLERPGDQLCVALPDG
jgi:hypothetical protein